MKESNINHTFLPKNTEDSMYVVLLSLQRLCYEELEKLKNN